MGLRKQRRRKGRVKGKSENEEERVIRVKWDRKEDGGVGKKGGQKKEEEGWGILTTLPGVAPDNCRGQRGAGRDPLHRFQGRARKSGGQSHSSAFRLNYLTARICLSKANGPMMFIWL